MSHNKLVPYIVNQLHACVPEQDITAILQENKWPTQDIEKAFHIARSSPQSQNHEDVCAVRVDFTGTSRHVIVPLYKGSKKYILLSIATLFLAGGIFFYIQTLP
ncbi:MAG: hypothetical protein WC099_01000 [Candidatus Paceibacterota bacterium]